MKISLVRLYTVSAAFFSKFFPFRASSAQDNPATRSRPCGDGEETTSSERSVDESADDDDTFGEPFQLDDPDENMFVKHACYDEERLALDPVWVNEESSSESIFISSDSDKDGNPFGPLDSDEESSFGAEDPSSVSADDSSVFGEESSVEVGLINSVGDGEDPFGPSDSDEFDPFDSDEESSFGAEDPSDLLASPFGGFRFRPCKNGAETTSSERSVDESAADDDTFGEPFQLDDPDENMSVKHACYDEERLAPYPVWVNEEPSSESIFVSSDSDKDGNPFGPFDSDEASSSDFDREFSSSEFISVSSDSEEIPDSFGGFRFRPCEDGVEITGYSEDAETTLAVPDELLGRPVRRIGDGAFKGCSLKRVEFPKGLKVIGEYAFADCSSLATATFREELQTIGERAFIRCKSLEDVELPSGLQTLGNSAFEWCRSLKRVVFPEKLETIGMETFYHCESLTEVELPCGLKNVGNEAFTGCRLKSVTMPKDLETIRFAFADCDLWTVKLPSSLEEFNFGYSCAGFEIPESNPYFRTIDGVLFDKEAKALIAYPKKKKGESYVVPEGVETIGNGAFGWCRSLERVAFPEGLKTIGDAAFANCSSLATASFQEGLQTIGERAFYGCNSLEDVELPKGLQTVGDSAFEWCHSLKRVAFPEGLKTIGDDALVGCDIGTVKLPSSLEKCDFGFSCAGFEISESNPFFRTIDGVLFDKEVKALLAYPKKKKRESYVVPEGVETIGNGAFEGCSLKRVILPESLQTIEAWAFYDCDSLADVELPKGLQTVGNSAFKWCRSLERVVFLEGLKTIGDEAFLDCDDLETVKLPSSLEKFDFRFHCAGFEISESNPFFRTIDGVLFDKEAKVLLAYPKRKRGENYVVPEGVETIGNRAFEDCSLKRVKLPRSLQTIGDFAFANCFSLVDATFQNDPQSIGTCAFIYCHSLKTENIPESVKKALRNDLCSDDDDIDFDLAHYIE